MEMAKVLNLTRDGISYNIKILKEKELLKELVLQKMEYGEY